MNTPPLDPKGRAGAKKLQLQLIQPALMEETAKALQRGAEKYGAWNQRRNSVKLMVYVGAIRRHLNLLVEGEDIDDDSTAHHLGCIAANCGVALDARKHGTLVDDRPGSEYFMQNPEEVSGESTRHADVCPCMYCESLRTTIKIQCKKCGRIYTFDPKSNICPKCGAVT